MAGGFITTLFARSANFRVDWVSWKESIEGDTQIMRTTAASGSIRLSLSTLVSMQLRKGMCLRLLSDRALMHLPSSERLALIDVSSETLTSELACPSEALYFSEPARSTMRIQPG